MVVNVDAVESLAALAAIVGAGVAGVGFIARATVASVKTHTAVLAEQLRNLASAVMDLRGEFKNLSNTQGEHGQTLAVLTSERTGRRRARRSRKV